MLLHHKIAYCYIHSLGTQYIYSSSKCLFAVVARVTWHSDRKPPHPVGGMYDLPESSLGAASPLLLEWPGHWEQGNGCVYCHEEDIP